MTVSESRTGRLDLYQRMDIALQFFLILACSEIRILLVVLRFRSCRPKRFHSKQTIVTLSLTVSMIRLVSESVLLKGCLDRKARTETPRKNQIPSPSSRITHAHTHTHTHTKKDMIKMDEPNTAGNVVDDKKDDQHIVSSDDDEDDDALEEGEAKLRSIHFLHQKKESSLGQDDDDNDGAEERIDVSSQRYDEMASFLTRSQRSLEMPDPQPSQEELEQRRVHVQEEPLAIHEEKEPLSAEEVKAYYMGEEDFRRVDVDVELTTMRWEKAQKNKGTKFDSDENPTRGLEEMMDKKKLRSTLRKKHRQAVLEEMVRQKVANPDKPLDQEKIRAVAEPYSKQTAQIAYEIALEDAGESVSKGIKSSGGSGGEKKKKKGGLFGMFKKK
mmetsp:Transcript_13552/g.25865  ORF Transcript_13552/g.25865 Transcript_13552/m.25865 type:complete len:385 (+) Transcript_13552:328-1482(+)